MLPFTSAVLNARQFLPDSTDVAGCPKADAHATYSLQFGCGYLSGCDVPLKADKADTQLTSGFAC
jgi:hypothetical protein